MVQVPVEVPTAVKEPEPLDTSELDHLKSLLDTKDKEKSDLTKLVEHLTQKNATLVGENDSLKDFL